jgi:hypothetical protein
MAKPIGATPELKGKEAIAFIIKMHENESKPVGLVATPKLARTQKLISQFNPNGQKYIR